MKKKHFKTALVTGLLLATVMINAQTGPAEKEPKVSFDLLIKNFQDYFNKELGYSLKYNASTDSNEYKIKLPVLWDSKERWIDEKEKAYTVEISDNPISLKLKEIVLSNPYDDSFPLSYSVIFQDRLISLFQPGYFVCHTIPDMQRDLLFEKKLNTHQFTFHWLIDNKLIGLSDNKYYYFNSKNKWVRYKEHIPLFHQSKFFEDESYIVYTECVGEFGGTLFFYNKATHKIYFTRSTCATTIYAKDGKYYVLSELGHMFGHTSLREIANPEELTPVTQEEINNHFRASPHSAFGSSDSSKNSRLIFDFTRIGFLSSFDYKGRIVYLTYLYPVGSTFLSEIDNKTIKVVHPLFNNALYTHYPVTTIYPDVILINACWYMIGRDKEISCFIIKDDAFIKIDWNKKYR